MSADLLRDRLTGDLARVADEYAAILVEKSQAPIDEMRFNQGVIAGLRLAKTKLDERIGNLHSNG